MYYSGRLMRFTHHIIGVLRRVYFFTYEKYLSIHLIQYSRGTGVGIRYYS